MRIARGLRGLVRHAQRPPGVPAGVPLARRQLLDAVPLINRLGDRLEDPGPVHVRGVALEDALPAGVEVVNPNLALVGKFYQLPPPDPQDRLLGLSYSEMRDRAALLYFDTVDPGSGTYSILARATTAGTFRWPAGRTVSCWLPMAPSPSSPATAWGRLSRIGMVPIWKSRFHER